MVAVEPVSPSTGPEGGSRFNGVVIGVCGGSVVAERCAGGDEGGEMSRVS